VIPSVDPARPGDRAAPGPSSRVVFRALCNLLARTQITRVRIGALLALGGLAIMSGVAYRSGVRTGTIDDPLAEGATWINDFGLGFVVPVATLLFASSMFGDPRDDKTLVYLWLKPIRRSQLTTAAALTSFVITWPLVVPALVITAAFTGGGRDLVLGTLVACTVSVAGYTGLFVALGARLRLPLVWGLLYIIIWEKYVAGASKLTASIAIRGYGSSILHYFTKASLSMAKLDLGLIPSIAIPIAIGGAALVYTTRRLQRQDVD
jgi:ABC-2 type transport system permease protein